MPSAAFQISVAVSLRLKSVESVADMIIISPPISRAATAVLRGCIVAALLGVVHSDQLPGTRVGREDQLGDLDAGDKFENGIKNAGDDIFFFGEEQDVAHEGAGRVDFGDRLDAIFGALHEEIERFEWSGSVGADASEFAGEGRTVGGVVPLPRPPDVGDFVGEHGGVTRGEARHRGFASAGNAGEEEGASLRIALAAWTRKPPSSARTSECVMRRTVSME